MAEFARRNRGGARPEAEALEGRMLLSRAARGAPHVSYTSQAALAVHYSQDYVSPQSGEVYVSVTRSSYGANRALPIRIQTSAIVNDPAHPNSSPYIRTMGRNPSALPFVPIDGIYKFAPGQTILTIPIKLNPNYAAKGDILLDVVARSAHASSWMPGRFLSISTSPAEVPPELLSWTVSPQAITMTFSKAMDPATVEDINNYQIDGYLTLTGPAVATPPAAVSRAPTPVSRAPGLPAPAPVPAPAPGPSPVTGIVALKSAVYDPATRTVTLTPTEPLAPATWTYDAWFPFGSYTTAPGGRVMKPLTDLQGNALVVFHGLPRPVIVT
jgi:hypothetical protein